MKRGAMPNWCENDLYIRGDQVDLNEFVTFAVGTKLWPGGWDEEKTASSVERRKHE
jgi:hypothetical protein